MKIENPNIENRDVAGVFAFCDTEDGIMVAVVEGKPKPSKDNKPVVSFPKGHIEAKESSVDNNTSPDEVISKVAESEDQKVMETGPEAAIRELA